mmetsp:Transcript_12352/g.26688  ORF Transcript_12352/g.26688 Transcript_12352/m.26688 type:complete len:214 (+) Transcript_12352:1058-1699(+)
MPPGVTWPPWTKSTRSRRSTSTACWWRSLSPLVCWAVQGGGPASTLVSSQSRSRCCAPPWGAHWAPWVVSVWEITRPLSTSACQAAATASPPPCRPTLPPQPAMHLHSSRAGPPPCCPSCTRMQPRCAGSCVRSQVLSCPPVALPTCLPSSSCSWPSPRCLRPRSATRHGTQQLQRCFSALRTWPWKSTMCCWQCLASRTLTGLHVLRASGSL